MKTERSVFAGKSVAALFALVLTLVATTAALAAPSIAQFEAEGYVIGVAPGSEIDARFFRSPGTGELRTVIVRTSGEAVFGVLDPGVTECSDRDGNVSCSAVSTLLTGSGVLSLHDSTAVLRNIVELPNGTVSGSLSGVLRGDFTVTNGPNSGAGEAMLRISGTAVYACVDDSFVQIPMASCEAGLGGFIPVYLNVVDSGVFSMGSFDGPSTVNLSSLSGRLEVRIDGLLTPGGVIGDTSISVENGKAKFN